MTKRTFLELGLATAGLASAGLAALPAFGQARYPERPIRLVVPFAPGGDGDLMARLWAKYAGPLVGGTFVPDGRALQAAGRPAGDDARAL
jgi:tripartite-type tricarboxylate transporter receptor subunit TctC